MLNLKRAIALLMFALFDLGCSPSSHSSRMIVHPAQAWVGEEASLFDDSIDGYTSDANVARMGRLLSRAKIADGICFIKIIGIAREPSSQGVRFRLEFQFEQQPLKGKAQTCPQNLAIEPQVPAFRTVESQESVLLNSRYVLLYRRYESTESFEPIVRFHASVLSAEQIETLRFSIKQ